VNETVNFDYLNTAYNHSPEDIFKRIGAAAEAARKMVIMGIGNFNRSDDAIGAHVISSIIENITGAEEYRDFLKFKDKDGGRELLLIAAAVTPENFVDEIIDFSPDFILYIDCANFNDPSIKAGELRLFNETSLAVSKNAVSTHSMSINLLIEIFKHKIPGAKNLFLGIMPESIEYDYSPDYFKSITPQVLKSGEKTIEYIKTNILSSMEVI
jgi:hydrogenase maturation protease